MATDLPTREQLRRGMTVEIVQEPGDAPITGEVLKVLTEEHTHPKGIKVKLENGATGRVKQIAPD